MTSSSGQTHTQEEKPFSLKLELLLELELKLLLLLLSALYPWIHVLKSQLSKSTWENKDGKIYPVYLVHDFEKTKPNLGQALWLNLDMQDEWGEPCPRRSSESGVEGQECHHFMQCDRFRP